MAPGGEGGGGDGGGGEGSGGGGGGGATLCAIVAAAVRVASETSTLRFADGGGGGGGASPSSIDIVACGDIETHPRAYASPQGGMHIDLIHKGSCLTGQSSLGSGCKVVHTEQLSMYSDVGSEAEGVSWAEKREGERAVAE
jgi:hypothetical protein